MTYWSFWAIAWQNPPTMTPVNRRNNWLMKKLKMAIKCVGGHESWYFFSPQPALTSPLSDRIKIGDSHFYIFWKIQRKLLGQIGTFDNFFDIVPGGSRPSDTDIRDLLAELFNLVYKVKNRFWAKFRFLFFGPICIISSPVLSGDFDVKLPQNKCWPPKLVFDPSF